MPVPIIDRQRGLSRIGEIRIGGEKPARGAGKKLEAFRLTSQHKDIIERAAGLYGGQPSEWESPSGPAWQLYTTASSLPVMLITGYSLRQTYELREGQTCVRRCDGVHEDMADVPCICNAEGSDRCDVITRLMVVLPETGTSLGWQLRSQGENAARELAGAVMIGEQMAGTRAFVPATLRLTQRRNVVNGQTVRYVVPVLDFDILAQREQIGAPTPEPLAHTPIAELPQATVTIEQGLALAEKDDTRSSRKAPLPDADDIPFGDEPVPVNEDPNRYKDSGNGPSTAIQMPPAEKKPEFISVKQRRRLFAIAQASGVEEEGLREFIRTYTGQESSAEITLDAYEPLCAAIESQKATA